MGSGRLCRIARQHALCVLVVDIMTLSRLLLLQVSTTYRFTVTGLSRALSSLMCELRTLIYIHLPSTADRERKLSCEKYEKYYI